MASERIDYNSMGNVFLTEVPLRTETSTVYHFDTAGQLLFACHLPGHFQYGMSGLVTIR